MNYKRQEARQVPQPRRTQLQQERKAEQLPDPRGKRRGEREPAPQRAAADRAARAGERGARESEPQPRPP